MTPRRAAGILLVSLAAVALIAGMVRYTKRVESELKGAPAGSRVALLKNRVAVPAFTAPDIDGRPVSTAALRGKVVIVNFWATWCPPCREEIPDLIALQNKYKDQVQIVGVAQDSGSPEAIKAFAAKYGMNYPIVISTPDIEKIFPGVSALPTTFILDRDGRLAQKHIGMLIAARTELETLALSGKAPELEIVDAEDEDKARLEEAKVRVKNAAQANKIPGVDLAALSPEVRAKVLEQLNSEHCTCGCNLTLAQCRIDDPSCNVSLPIAQELVKKASAPASPKPSGEGGK
jgi:thiol-disulfide isomerase/thioredoxin